jgi:integrase
VLAAAFLAGPTVQVRAPGMHFHDLRPTYKTWLIEDDIPEIAQAKRLGHRIPDVRGIYSHVTPAMQQRITAGAAGAVAQSHPRSAAEHRHLHAA